MAAAEAKPPGIADRIERLHQRQDRLLAEIDRLDERVAETLRAVSAATASDRPDRSS